MLVNRQMYAERAEKDFSPSEKYQSAAEKSKKDVSELTGSAAAHPKDNQGSRSRGLRQTPSQQRSCRSNRYRHK
ncbi:hypothetical protein [Paenibacillus alginolyticus]|uniref:Uncharacterized protein n=1 Tax=Paenibacillus alginolyticus TaxID=59839 RepID=A0ABT4G9M0_9BACL|nr:hypothetical protein [Paenibacillus alginolyticus]MCY9692880.1 hypothetical protein [Paenibacillus alginolyticus]